MPHRGCLSHRAGEARRQPPASRSHSRRGMTLLEVVVAITLLLVGGTSLVGMMLQATDAVAQMHERERALRDASRFLEAVALWPRTDLDLRLGEHPQGDWRLRVTRVTPTLYELVLLDGRDAGMRAPALLKTAVFRSVADTLPDGLPTRTSVPTAAPSSREHHAAR